MGAPAYADPAPLHTRAGRDVRPVSLRLLVLAVAGVATVWTTALVVAPALRLQVLAPDARLPFEVLGAAVVVGAALVMALPVLEGDSQTRSALLAGLVVLGVANAVAVLRLGGPGAGIVSWIAARWVVSVLFLLGGLAWPRWSTARYITAGLGVWAAVEASLLLSGLHRWSPPIGDGPHAAVAVAQLLPAVVFGVGSLLAMRLHLRTGDPELRWITLALEVQVVAQVHEILVPTFQGPWLTTADLLRLGSFLLLLAGAGVQVRRLQHQRLATIAWQRDDLAVRDELLARLARFADREAHFRALVAHELATPLATIEAHAHVVGRSLHDPGTDADVVLRAVDGLRTESRRLGELAARVDELRELDLDDVAARLRPVPAAPLVEEACAFARTIAPSHDVVCDASHARVAADPVRLGQALRNVLANAVRYSPAGSTVTVTAHVAGDRYVVRVADRGPGIRPDERHRVLAAHVRGGAGDRAPGSGIGLYVAHRVMAAHGGTLEIGEQSHGPGAVVTMTVGVAT